MRNLFIDKGIYLRGFVITILWFASPIILNSSVNSSYAAGVQAPINLGVINSDWVTIPLTGGANQKSSFYVNVPLVTGVDDYRLFVYSAGATVEIITSSLTLVGTPTPVNWTYANGQSVDNVLTQKYLLESLPAGIEYNFGIQSIDPQGGQDSEITLRNAAPLKTRLRPRIESVDQSSANLGDVVGVNGSNLDWIDQLGNEDGLELKTCVEDCGTVPIDEPIFRFMSIPLTDFTENTSTKITFLLPNQLPVGVQPGALWEIIPNAWGASGSASLTIGSSNGEILRTISVTSGSNGVVTPGTSSTISDGSTPTYTITPDAGYEIASATLNGTSILDSLSSVDGASKSYTFDALTRNHSMSVTFRLPQENQPTNLQDDMHGEYEYVGDGTSQLSFFQVRWEKVSNVLEYKVRVTPVGGTPNIYLFTASEICRGTFCYARISELNTGPDYQIEVASVGGLGRSDSNYVSRLYNNDAYPSIFHTYFKPVNISISDPSPEPGDLISITGAHLDLAQRIGFDAFEDESLINPACWIDENEDEICGEFSIEASDFQTVSPNSISFYIPSSFPLQLPASTYWQGYAYRTDGNGSFGRVHFSLTTSLPENNPPIAQTITVPTVPDNSLAEQRAAIQLAAALAERRVANELAAARAVAEKLEAEVKAEGDRILAEKLEADAKAEAAFQAAQVKALEEAAKEAALMAARNLADVEVKVSAEAAANLKLPVKKIVPEVTLHSISSSLKLSSYDNAYLKKFATKLKANAEVKCVGYIYAKNTNYSDAQAKALSQAKAACALIKAQKNSTSISTILYEANKAPKAAIGARYVAVSYRVDIFES